MAYWLGSSIRKADQKELGCTSGIEGPVEYQLQNALETADENCAAVCGANGEIFGIFGHGEMPPGTDPSVKGYVWLISTDDLFTRHAKTATRIARDKFLPHVLETYGSVGNYVHSDNHVHLNWLSRLGFEPAGLYEINGEPFTLMKL